MADVASDLTVVLYYLESLERQSERYRDQALVERGKS